MITLNAIGKIKTVRSLALHQCLERWDQFEIGLGKVPKQFALVLDQRRDTSPSLSRRVLTCTESVNKCGAKCDDEGRSITHVSPAAATAAQCGSPAAFLWTERCSRQNSAGKFTNVGKKVHNGRTERRSVPPPLNPCGPTKQPAKNEGVWNPEMAESIGSALDAVFCGSVKYVGQSLVN